MGLCNLDGLITGNNGCKIPELEVNEDLSGGSAATRMAHAVVPTTADKGPV